jgi:undecaprenyl-diphosphatase
MLHNLLQLDIAAFTFINSHHTPLFDVFFTIVTWFGNGWVAIPLAGTALFFFTPRRFLSRTLLIAAVAGTLTGIGNTQIKHRIDRARPCAFFSRASGPGAGYRVHVLGERLEQHSFPSGHSATAFSAATILVLFIKRKAFLFYAGAFLVAWSRIYVGAHFPLDALGGAILGCALPAIIILSFRRWIFTLPPAKLENSHDQQ